MSNIVITSGKNYIDIDALASVLAYCDLLKLDGVEAESVLEAPLNHSVTETIIKWGLPYSTSSQQNDADFVLIDVSEVGHFPFFVNQNRIVEIYDHHYGFENFWKERLGESAVIEPVGACATLIWEQYKKRNQNKKISALNANLLATAIISNTLDFQASITDERDKIAFNEIYSRSRLNKKWPKRYYEEQEQRILSNAVQAIIQDTKVQNIPNLGLDLAIGQIELWDGSRFITNNLQAIEAAMFEYKNKNWFLNCISISEGKNYIYTENEEVTSVLKKSIGAEFSGNIGITSKLWLRKEILHELYGIQ